MPFERSGSVLAVAIWLVPVPVLAEAPPISRDVLTTLEMTLNKETWRGDGIYLGQGLVLTAQHLVHPIGITHPKVMIDNVVIPGEPLKEGEADGVDLALLKIDDQKLSASFRQHHLVTLCLEPLVTGQRVITLSSQGTTRSRILDPSVLPKDIPSQFSTLIEDVAGTGNSGSGVFDEKTSCLLGMITRKIEKIMIAKSSEGQVSTTRESWAKYFEPASKIRDFVAQWIR